MANGLNTLNLIQVKGGVNIKQGDSSSVLEYELGYNVGSNMMSDLNLNGKAAHISLYNRPNNTKWTKDSVVRDNKVSFTINEALGLGVYVLDIEVDGHVFPSDREMYVRVHEGYESYIDGRSAAVAVATATNIANEGIRQAIAQNLDKIKGPKGDRGYTGPTGPVGPQGPQGVASKVTGSKYDSSGNTIITFNNSSPDVTIQRGKQGLKGDTGNPVNVSSVTKSGTTNAVKFTDGKTMKVEDGKSVNVSSTRILDDGNTEITFTDGKKAVVNKGVDGTVKFDDLTDEQRESLRGPKGERGPQGVPGKDGLNGKDGKTGPTGPQGERGLTGPTGPRGPKGADGVMTFADLTDEQRESLRGPKGERGLKGDKGEPGPKGERGPQGVPGKDGLNGKDGKTGPQGVPGKDGLNGKDGKTGPQGVPGKDGTNASVSIVNNLTDGGVDKVLSAEQGKKLLKLIEKHHPPKVMTAVIDQSNSNPLTCITYEDDAKMMEKGSPEWDDFFQSQLVLFKDGKEVRELEDSELNNLNPEDGDVMVRFPRKGLRIKTVGEKVYVSMTNKTDDPDFKYYAHSRGDNPRDAFYLGAYLGYEENSKLRSITNVKPVENKGISSFRQLGQAVGNGYEISGFYQLTFLQAMYVLKYGNLDSQTALGEGLTYGGKGVTNTTGRTNGKGIDYGTDSDDEQMKFQYLEDFWGNRLWAIDGIGTDSSCTLFTSTDKFNDSRSGYLNTGERGANREGYLSKVFGTSESGFVGKTFGGSSSSYYCDYSNTRSNYFMFFGGSADDGDLAGAFHCYLYSGATDAFWTFSARLMFL